MLDDVLIWSPVCGERHIFKYNAISNIVHHSVDLIMENKKIERAETYIFYISYTHTHATRWWTTVESCIHKSMKLHTNREIMRTQFHTCIESGWKICGSDDVKGFPNRNRTIRSKSKNWCCKTLKHVARSYSIDMFSLTLSLSQLCYYWIFFSGLSFSSAVTSSWMCVCFFFVFIRLLLFAIDLLCSALCRSHFVTLSHSMAQLSHYSKTWK